jgi:hypothetical protein
VIVLLKSAVGQQLQVMVQNKRSAQSPHCRRTNRESAVFCFDRRGARHAAVRTGTIAPLAAI